MKKQRYIMAGLILVGAAAAGVIFNGLRPPKTATSHAEAPLPVEDPKKHADQILTEGLRILRTFDDPEWPQKPTLVDSVNDVPMPRDLKGRLLTLRAFRSGLLVLCAEGDLIENDQVDYYCISDRGEFFGFARGDIDDPEPPTLAMYDQIQRGMTYDKVVQITGDSGTQTSANDMPGATTTSYSWGQPPKVGKRGIETEQLVVVFQNNKVYGKSQLGLK